MEANDILEEINYSMESKFERDKLEMENQTLEIKLAEKARELEQVSLKLERANADLFELEEAKSEFLSIISHEVRTSLNGILGSILLIKDKIQDDNCSVLLEILVSSATRLQKFSLTALSITELKTGVRKYSCLEINLDGLIRESLIPFHAVSLEKELKFDVSAISPDLQIIGDSDLMSMCITGIIGNAVKFSPPGSTINIRTGCENNSIICEITDEGPGFSATALRHLFKLFSPGEPHIDQNIGLDLSLAMQIMKAHCGKIEVENRENGGARVRLVFQGCGEGGYCD